MIDEIGNYLAEIFPSIPFYDENQTNGFQVPSFYLHEITTAVKPRLAGQQLRTYTWNLVYFGTDNRDLRTVQEQLLDNFTRVGDYATVRNRSFNLDSNETTLSMQFNLLLNMHATDSTPNMKEVEISGTAKDN